jgi:asparagine synthase (glutamine-hydrolysing)
MLHPDVRAGLTPATGDDLVAAMPEESKEWDPLSRAQWLEMTTLLPGYILASQGDRMLMANSVEGRFPFLDREVVELANALPSRHKLFGLDEKYLLKQAFGDLVPDEILHRPKQPYRAPDAASFFFAGSRPQWLDDVTSPAAIRECGLFDPGQVAGLFAKCERTGGVNIGNTDNMRVLAVVTTQLTYQHFIAGDGAAAGGQAPAEPRIVVDMASEDRSTDDRGSYVRPGQLGH